MRLVPLAILLGACAEMPPEIWLDRSPIELGVVTVDTTVSFGLQLSNQGGGILEVEPFALRGDDDCAFFLEGPDLTELAGPSQGFIRGTFSPSRTGLHEIAIYLNSNAETLPNLIVPICAMVDDGSGTSEPPEMCEEPGPEAMNCMP
ncbi:MAG: hypothetical protein AAF602_06470 [Myxococcota bacterium]